MSNITYTGVTSKLTISSENINTCAQVVDKMIQLGIMGKVYQNESILCENNKCRIENGCHMSKLSLVNAY